MYWKIKNVFLKMIWDILDFFNQSYCHWIEDVSTDIKKNDWKDLSKFCSKRKYFKSWGTQNKNLNF